MARRCLTLLSLAIFLGIVHLPQAQAATYTIPAGDTTALINALQVASDTPGTADVIDLAPGSTYILTEINNSYEEVHPTEGELLGGGDQGLPVIHGTITINGNNAVIERADDAPDFRIFLVSHNGNLTLNALSVRNGRSTRDDLGRGATGGAIYSSMANLTINDSFFTENYAAGGGALNSYKGTVSIYRSVFSGNIGTGGGGGIYDEYSIFTLDSSSIVSNLAGAIDSNRILGGGGIVVYAGLGSITKITNTTIANNTLLGPVSYGGGIYLYNDELSPIEISTNSTITGNYVTRYGGGLYSQTGGPVTIRNVTITDNVAGEEGGGVYNFPGSKWQIANTIFSNNLPLNCGSGEVSQLQSLGSNIDSDGSCNLSGNGDMANVDPLLQPLAYNGGLTATQLLMPDSPAIDTGNKARCPLTDQRGVQRGTACDIGAFELTSGDFIPVRNYYSTATPQLTWSRVAWATGYQVEIANNNAFHYPQFQSGILPSDTLSIEPTLPMNGLWYWRVHALREGDNWGSWSPIEAIRIEVSIP